MSKINLDDLWGRAAYEKLLETEQPPSQEFEEALHEVWARAERYSHTSQLSAHMWADIQDKLLTTVNPNNRLEAYEVCRAIKHLQTPSDFYDDEENLWREEKGFWVGLADKAFAEVAKKFPGTVLGDYCSFVSNPPDNLRHGRSHLIFNNTLG